MKKLAEWLSKHAVFINITATFLLIANALLLILNPKLWLQVLRYAFAAICVGLAGVNIATLIRK